MRRREFIRALGGVAAALPLSAHAQSRSRLPTIGVIGAGTQHGWSRWIGAFLQRLRELGWLKDGQSQSSIAGQTAVASVRPKLPANFRV